MIITDMKQIERIAEETFGNTKGVITIDMTDYALFKKYAATFKAIQLEVPTFTEDVVLSLVEALSEASKENVKYALMYIKGNCNDVEVEQFDMFIEAFNQILGNASVIWCMEDSEESGNNKSILILLGYSKKE